MGKSSKGSVHLLERNKAILRDKRILCLVDGEHYPPVTKWTLEEIEEMHGIIVSLVFLGGTEKVENAIEELGGEDVDYVVYMDKSDDELPFDLLEKAIQETGPDIVLDLSDEPVVDYKSRFNLICRTLKHEVTYMGADFVYDPPREDEILEKPSLSIIGTAKRVGKTAVGVTVAQILKKENFDPVVVCMGRGGPPEPDYVDTSKMEISSDTLISVAERGGHAASDYWEDALLGDVPTVGCRRCGGGMAGNPFSSNVLQGAMMTNEIPQKFVVMEGSGATFPPVKTDKRIVLVGAGQPIEHITGYLGEYRILTSQLAIVTMCEEPVADKEKVDAVYKGIREINPDMDIALTVFRPKPLGDISGKKVFIATTAKGEVADIIEKSVQEDYDCEVTGITTHLSNRPLLRKDLKEGLAHSDVLLTEIKAASIDVAAVTAKRKNVDVVFMHNEPVLVGGTVENIEKAIIDLCKEAKRRHSDG